MYRACILASLLCFSVSAQESGLPTPEPPKDDADKEAQTLKEQVKELSAKVKLLEVVVEKLVQDNEALKKAAAQAAEQPKEAIKVPKDKFGNAYAYKVVSYKNGFLELNAGQKFQIAAVSTASAKPWTKDDPVRIEYGDVSNKPEGLETVAIKAFKIWNLNQSGADSYIIGQLLEEKPADKKK